ncbi:MAG: helix-turn-helix domain-containing protein [Armatimonadota bacterium]
MLQTLYSRCVQHSVTLAKRLKALRLTRGASQGEVASWLHISRPAYSKYEAGISEPDVEKLKIIAERYGVSIDYLFGLDGNKKSLQPAEKAGKQESYTIGHIVSLPIVGEIRCGPAGIVDEIQDGAMVIDLDMFPFVIPDLRNWYWLRIKGDSMKDAGYHNGGVALIHKQDTVESGEIGVVMVDSESATLKRVFWHPDLKIVELRPDNEDFEPLLLPIDQVRVLGKGYGAFNFS